MLEAKPCPFCKSTKLSFTFPSNRSFMRSVICLNCNARGPEKITKTEAVNAWNNRGIKEELQL